LFRRMIGRRIPDAISTGLAPRRSPMPHHRPRLVHSQLPSHPHGVPSRFSIADRRISATRQRSSSNPSPLNCSTESNISAPGTIPPHNFLPGNDHPDLHSPRVVPYRASAIPYPAGGRTRPQDPALQRSVTQRALQHRELGRDTCNNDPDGPGKRQQLPKRGTIKDIAKTQSMVLRESSVAPSHKKCTSFVDIIATENQSLADAIDCKAFQNASFCLLRIRAGILPR
jgi:hypothetical protein